MVLAGKILERENTAGRIVQQRSSHDLTLVTALGEPNVEGETRRGWSPAVPTYHENSASSLKDSHPWEGASLSGGKLATKCQRTLTQEPGRV